MKRGWLIFDGQYGSTGKGLLAGYLGKIWDPDTVICAWSPNAGHTFVDGETGRQFIHRMIPNGIVSPRLKCVLIGPGALIDPELLWDELRCCQDILENVIVAIHEHAGICTPEHAAIEKGMGLSKIGSTTKGVFAAQVERMRRNPYDPPIARNRLIGTPLESYVVDRFEYLDLLQRGEYIQIEGAQGFSLSMYHGMYPYVTSRDVTPLQIFADCGIPINMAELFERYATLRTYPIRVNNRDGSSGPCYPDQMEITFESIGQKPELTTVTQLPRRLFTFSWQQLRHMVEQCAPHGLFLNFCNYCKKEEVNIMISDITSKVKVDVHWTGWGPTDADVRSI